MRTTGGLQVFGDGATTGMGEGTLTWRAEPSLVIVETLSVGKRRGWAVSMLRGRAGMSRDSEPTVDKVERRARD